MPEYERAALTWEMQPNACRFSLHEHGCMGILCLWFGHPVPAASKAVSVCLIFRPLFMLQLLCTALPGRCSWVLRPRDLAAGHALQHPRYSQVPLVPLLKALASMRMSGTSCTPDSVSAQVHGCDGWDPSLNSKTATGMHMLCHQE